MGASYDEIQTAIQKCEQSITFARKAEHRDKVKISKLRDEHYELTVNLTNTPKGTIEEKKDSKSEIQDFEEPKSSPKKETQGIKDKIKGKITSGKTYTDLSAKFK